MEWRRRLGRPGGANVGAPDVFVADDISRILDTAGPCDLLDGRIRSRDAALRGTLAVSLPDSGPLSGREHGNDAEVAIGWTISTVRPDSCSRTV
jgi:hypothetical protein